MKNEIFLLAFSLAAITTLAQEKRMCNAETMLNKPDVVLQKDYMSINKVAGVSMSVETITDVTSGQKLTALDLEYSVVSQNGNGNKSVLLDPDEVDGVISFFQSMMDTYFKNPAPTDDKEYVFVTKSGFEAGAYWGKGWNAYVRIDTHDGRTNVELNREDLTAFLSFLKQAKVRM